MNGFRMKAGTFHTIYALLVIAVCAVVSWLIIQENGLSQPANSTRDWLITAALMLIPILFLTGWWLHRKSLKPLRELAQRVERFNVKTLGQRLPRTHSGNEADRMAASFNKMAERLEQSFQQISEFTLHGSHELKTPLTVMRAQLEITLRKADSLPPELQTALESLLDEVTRLAKIVDGLTLLTKADAGMVALDTHPVRLDELLSEAVEDADVLAQPGAIKVNLARCDKTPINGDRHRLRQVLLNLADNAIKYNQPGGSVEFSLQNEGEFAELVVTNTGPGISAELLPRVFERFARGKNALHQSLEGSGLGLTIAKWIVEAHGGLMRIASEPGRTTSVAVRIPVAHPVELDGSSV